MICILKRATKGRVEYCKNIFIKRYSVDFIDFLVVNEAFLKFLEKTFLFFWYLGGFGFPLRKNCLNIPLLNIFAFVSFSVNVFRTHLWLDLVIEVFFATSFAVNQGSSSWCTSNWLLSKVYSIRYFQVKTLSLTSEL